MNGHHTQNKLVDMRLHGMVNLSQRYSENPKIIPETSQEYFASMVDAEYHERRHRKQLRMMKNARLKYPNACLEDFDFSIERGVSREMIAWISGFAWLEKKQNLIITGATGAGKTNTACAVANNAIRQGYSALYKRVPRLCEELEVAHGDGSLPSVRAKIQKFNLLILDEWAVSPLTPRARVDLLEIVEDRSGTGSLIITSQMPIGKWHDFIAEPTIADALLDRIIHRSHKIEMIGGSMRRIRESV